MIGLIRSKLNDLNTPTRQTLLVAAWLMSLLFLVLGSQTAFRLRTTHQPSHLFQNHHLESVGDISYRWESPDAKDLNTFVGGSFTEEQWTRLSGLHVPNKKAGHQIVWESFVLPKDNNGAYLYLRDVEQSIEVYLDAKIIYKHGDIQNQAPGYFPGWGWHLVKLPNDFSGKRIYVRIGSNWNKIGFSSSVLIGNSANIFQKIIFEDMVELVLGGCLLIMGLITIAVVQFVSRDMATWSQALLFIASGLILLERTFIGRLLWYDNATWSRISLYCLFLLPCFLATFIGQCIYPRFRRTMKASALFYLGFTLLVGCGDLFWDSFNIGTAPFAYMYSLFITTPLVVLVVSRATDFTDKKILPILLVLSTTVIFAALECCYQFGWIAGGFYFHLFIFSFVFLTIFMQFRKTISKIQKSTLEFVERMSSLSKMAGGIAHEINNPMAIMLGHVERIKKEITKPQINQTAVMVSYQTVIDMISRITRITDGMLHFAKDTPKGVQTIVLAEDVVDEAVKLCQSEFLSSGIFFEKKVDLSHVQLSCQAAQISQVLLALLFNAIEAVKDQPEKWIHLEGMQTKHQVLIMITDSGAGIPFKEQKQIFLPFHTSKGFSGGSHPGLGLAISHSILESHGGSIYLDNKCPNTRFIVALPKYMAPSHLKRAG